MSDTSPPDLITPKRLAQIHGVHIGTVHRWIKRGKLRAWRLAGERYLVSEAEGHALLVRVQAQPPPGRERTASEAEAAALMAQARLAQRGYRVEEEGEDAEPAA